MGPDAGPTGELAEVVSLAERAGRELVSLFRSPSARLEVDFKGPRDLVTLADRRSEELIVSSLLDRYPDDAILSEERGVTGASALSAPRLWIIDPLDGTTNFAHGHPLFAVSIGLWSGGEPRLGVVHAPTLGETFAAVKGCGAFLNGAAIRVTEETNLAHAIVATGFSYSREEVSAGALESFQTLLHKAREIRRGGSACLDLAYTAAGIFAGFWEYHLQPHDVGAGALLVREAGGVVTDVAGSDDFLFGRSIVAGAPPIHARLLGELAGGARHPGRAGS